ncbi:MAG: cadherin repeat domain-containing protein, partial [bacterium]|nr:cadherin repeat domain-containing protein [bacterium]
MRFYDSSGVATSAEISLGGDGQADVAALGNGNTVVVYGDNGEVSAQILDSTGAVVVTEFGVNSSVAGQQSLPSVVATADGGFVVTWQSDTGDGDGSGVFAQRFDASGNSVGPEVLVNTTTAGHQTSPEVIELASGEIVFGWSSASQDNSGTAVVTRATEGVVAENAADGTVVTRVTGVVDPDSGVTRSFSLVDSAGGRFVIHASSGEVTVADGSLLDFETATSHNITVRVTDSGGLTYDEVVTISVTDVNDAPTLAASAANDTLTENTDTTSAAVFSTVTIDPIETGDSISEAQVTLAGGLEDSDIINVNGTAITGLTTTSATGAALAS